MRSRLLWLLSTALLATAVPASAQFQGIRSAGDLIGNLFGSIFGLVSDNPAIWMKVFLTIALAIIIWIGLKKWEAMAEHRNAHTALSIAFALLAIAPLPASFIDAMVQGAGVIALIIYIIPFIILIYYTHKEAETHSRGRYIINILLWVVVGPALLGIGSKANIPQIGLAMPFLLLLVVVYVVISISKLWGGSEGRREAEVERDIARQEQELAAATQQAAQAEQAAQSAQQAAQAAQQTAQQEGQRAAQALQELQNIKGQLETANANAEAARKEAEQKLNEAREAEKKALAQAEKDRAAREAAEAADKARQAKEAADDAGRKAVAELQALLQPLTDSITRLRALLQTLDSIEKQLASIKRLKKQVDDALNDLDRLRSDVRSVTNISGIEKEVRDLNDANLITQFNVLKTEIDTLQARITLLGPIETKLKQHFDYFKNNLAQMEKLLRQTKTAEAIINEFTSTRETIMKTLKAGTTAAQVAPLVASATLRLKRLTEVTQALIVRLVNLQTLAQYQGQVAKAMREDLREWFSAEDNIQKQLLPALRTTIVTLQSGIETAKRAKAERDRQLAEAARPPA